MTVTDIKDGELLTLFTGMDANGMTDILLGRKTIAEALDIERRIQ